MNFEYPKTLADFVSDSSFENLNPLFSLAVANMRLTQALGRAVKIQTDVVRTISNQIEMVSDLNLKISNYRKNKSDIDALSDFGSNNEDALEMMNACLANGVEKKTIQFMYDAYNSGNRVQINDKTIDFIKNALGTRTESLNTASSKQSLTLQTLSSRYNQSNEQASTSLQKDAQTKSIIINNARGIS